MKEELEEKIGKKDIMAAAGCVCLAGGVLAPLIAGIAGGYTGNDYTEFIAAGITANTAGLGLCADEGRARDDAVLGGLCLSGIVSPLTYLMGFGIGKLVA